MVPLIHIARIMPPQPQSISADAHVVPSLLQVVMTARGDGGGSADVRDGGGRASSMELKLNKPLLDAFLFFNLFIYVCGHINHQPL